MPFLSAGDPDLPATLALIRELSDAGVDLIEIGFPYSDPIADGPVIQASYSRALDRGVTVAGIFDALESLEDRESLPPLVGMVAYAIIYRTGPDTFITRAKQAGLSGLIVPDLPGDEAEEFSRLVFAAGLDLIQLVAPTTPEQRTRRILEHASGFVYCISIAGTTGVREGLPEELRLHLQQLRSQTTLPLAVGFGISRPEHVDSLRGVAEGVIVGSAIVRLLEPIAVGTSTPAEAIAAVGAFARQMVAACRNT